jgi:hypothetical protein
MTLRQDLSWIRGETRHVARVARARRAEGLPPFRLAEASARKTSDTLVVLGSGRSVCRLDAADWQRIGRDHDTLGLNFWMLHPFTPTFYQFEAGPTPECTRQFEDFLAERASRMRDVLMLYKDLERHRLDLSRLPPAAPLKHVAQNWEPVSSVSDMRNRHAHDRRLKAADPPPAPRADA